MVASSLSNSWMTVLLLSAGVVSVAVTARLAVPLVVNFAVNDLPAVWSVVVTWLKPPYLYVIVNVIIITIVASTRFQHNHRHHNQSQQVDVYNQSSDPSPSDLPPIAIHLSFGVMEPPPASYDIKPCVTVAVGDEDEDEFITKRSTWDPPFKDNLEFNFPLKEKQPAMSGFAHNRKPAKNTPEGARALRVLKPKKHETLDSTWRMITATRQFRKSDTFVNLHHDRKSGESTKAVRKSETFKDYENQNHSPQSSAVTGEKLKKYLSPSHEELNRRVEAFIKKFNDDMKLQRQESLKQYMEMVNHGTR